MSRKDRIRLSTHSSKKPYSPKHLRLIQPLSGLKLRRLSTQTGRRLCRGERRHFSYRSGIRKDSHGTVAILANSTTSGKFTAAARPVADYSGATTSGSQFLSYIPRMGDRCKTSEERMKMHPKVEQAHAMAEASRSPKSGRARERW